MERHEAEQAITAVLGPHERLLWSGTPPQGFLLRAEDTLTIPLSLLWGGLACSLEILALATDAALYVKLWGIPFAFVGLYVIFGRFWSDAKVRAHTAYGLTDRRAIVVSGERAQSVRSVPVDTSADIVFEEFPDGRGTITFGTPPPRGKQLLDSIVSGTGGPMPPQFELIERVREVYDQFNAARTTERAVVAAWGS